MFILNTAQYFEKYKQCLYQTLLSTLRNISRPRHEVRSSARRTSPLTMVNLWNKRLVKQTRHAVRVDTWLCESVYLVSLTEAVPNHSLVTGRLASDWIWTRAFFVIRCITRRARVRGSPCTQGGLKPGLQPYVLFRGQTSPQVALVQWNCCIMWAKLRIRIYVIQLCIKTCKMQRFHWTRATCGDVWPRKSTHGCKPGFRPPCVYRQDDSA